MTAPDMHRAPSHSRLYRDPERGKLLGVCAGIAGYFGVDPWLVRIVTIVGLVLFTAPTVIAYLAAGFVLERRPPNLYGSSEEEAFWRDVRVEPSRTVRDLAHRLRDLERRLRAAEAYVTSTAFKLDREFRDLDRSR